VVDEDAELDGRAGLSGQCQAHSKAPSRSPLGALATK
jgi:hypothetical protein